jgi:hypothetical protein
MRLRDGRAGAVVFAAAAAHAARWLSSAVIVRGKR